MLTKQSKIFFAVLALLILSSIAFTYYKYVIQKDFKYFTDEQMFSDSLSEE